MSVDDIDGEGTRIAELDPGRLADRLPQAAADLQKGARELVHAHPAHKCDAAGRLMEMVREYVALCDRHAQVRWDDWNRVEKLRRVAKSLRELGEVADGDRFDALAAKLAAHCFEELPQP